MIVVNSVCGCAAGKARPGYRDGAAARRAVPIMWARSSPAPTSRPPSERAVFSRRIRLHRRRSRFCVTDSSSSCSSGGRSRRGMRWASPRSSRRRSISTAASGVDEGQDLRARRVEPVHLDRGPAVLRRRRRLSSGTGVSGERSREASRSSRRDRCRASHVCRISVRDPRRWLPHGATRRRSTPCVAYRHVYHMPSAVSRLRSHE